jgi:hypothetical protein
MSQYMRDDEVKALAGANDSTVRRLAAEVLRLRAAIAAHADKRGHELCWLNDLDLWKAAGLDAGYPHDSLPVREEFLAQCQRYYASRVNGSPYAEPSTATPVTARPRAE